jgi:enolase
MTADRPAAALARAQSMAARHLHIDSPRQRATITRLILSQWSTGILSGKITAITAREILALRGNVCLEVKVTTDSGFTGRSTPEVGVSTGTYEATMVLDGGERYGGMGVRQAARNVVEQIAPRLIGMEVSRQREIDQISARWTARQQEPARRQRHRGRLSSRDQGGRHVRRPAALPYIGGPDASTLPIPIVGIGTGGR